MPAGMVSILKYRASLMLFPRNFSVTGKQVLIAVPMLLLKQPR